MYIKYITSTFENNIRMTKEQKVKFDHDEEREFAAILKNTGVAVIM